jgi:hypothetical protein
MRNGPVVFGVNVECTHTGHIRDLECAPERIQQQPGTDATTFLRCNFSI